MNIKINKAMLPISLFLLSSPAFAFEDNGLIESNLETVDAMETLSGITFDRTITQTGFSFYQEFTRLWLAEANAGDHSLTIRETPTARHRSIIWIEEGSKLLHRLSIGMRNRSIAQKAEESLQATRRQLRNNDFNSTLF